MRERAGRSAGEIEATDILLPATSGPRPRIRLLADSKHSVPSTPPAAAPVPASILTVRRCGAVAASRSIVARPLQIPRRLVSTPRAWPWIRSTLDNPALSQRPVRTLLFCICYARIGLKCNGNRRSGSIVYAGNGHGRERHCDTRRDVHSLFSSIVVGHRVDVGGPAGRSGL